MLEVIAYICYLTTNITRCTGDKGCRLRHCPCFGAFAVSIDCRCVENLGILWLTLGGLHWAWKTGRRHTSLLLYGWALKIYEQRLLSCVPAVTLREDYIHYFVLIYSSAKVCQRECCNRLMQQLKTEG